jgi:uncharacterized membrane protein
MKVHKPLHVRLAEKGWSQEEIDKTMHMMHHPDKKEKHITFSKDMNWIIYWTVLLVLTISNFLVSLVLIPFLLAMSPRLIEIMVVVLGFIFGLIFNHLIWGLEHIERKHHYAAALFIPAIAVANIIFMVTIAKSMAEQAADIVGLAAVEENAVLISLLYVGAFILPYLFSVIRYSIGKHEHSHDTTKQEYIPPHERKEE